MKSRSRAGFTLIELMVAMALTMFIMVILSQAFVMSLETFSGMKGIGDMQIKLRTAEVILRDDLRNDHFEGKRRLSDLTLTAGDSQLRAQMPQAGFLAVRRSSAVPTTVSPPPPPYPPYVLEGFDASGMPSRRATDHMVYMTVKRKGNRQEDFFSASLTGNRVVLGQFFGAQTAYDVNGISSLPYFTQTSPYVSGSTSGTYNGQWAEVLYYLIRTGSTQEPNNPASTLGTPIWALYRAQFVMVPDATHVNGNFLNNLKLSTFASLSCNPGSTKQGHLDFYSPADAALGHRVIPDLAAFTAPASFDPANPYCAASTLVLPNVISFEIQVMRLSDATFDPNNLPNIGTGSLGIYDTIKIGATGYPSTGLKGIQITLRVWENNTRQTRQTTIVQDL